MTTDTVSLTLEIGGTRYHVTPRGDRRFLLEKRDGTVYEIAYDPLDNTASCECADHRNRHADLPGSLGCKHVRAIRAAGLIPQPTGVADIRQCLMCGSPTPATDPKGRPRCSSCQD